MTGRDTKDDHMTHSVATAADYAEAMFTARAARNWLVGLLALMLVAQLGLFFTAKYTTLFGPRGANTVVTTSSEPLPATQPATIGGTTQPVTTETTTTATTPTGKRITLKMLHYLVGSITFLGMIFSIVLTIVLLLILIIMLVGRLIGVSHVTSAFVWCLILALLLFPWQAFLNNADLTAVEFKIPGVFYTWEELMKYKDFPNQPLLPAMLKWARFVGFPVVALVLLFVVQSKSSRGLRLALGEEHVVEVGQPPA
jgi:hypothetical protein